MLLGALNFPLVVHETAHRFRSEGRAEGTIAYSVAKIVACRGRGSDGKVSDSGRGRESDGKM